MTEINSIKTDCSFSFTNITLMGFLPHAHRISLLSPAPVSHIFHNCRPSMPRKQKTALVPTPIKQSHEAMVFSYRPQTLHDTIHTVSSPCNSQLFGTIPDPFLDIHPASAKKNGFLYFKTFFSIRSSSCSH